MHSHVYTIHAGGRDRQILLFDGDSLTHRYGQEHYPSPVGQPIPWTEVMIHAVWAVILLLIALFIGSLARV